MIRSLLLLFVSWVSVGQVPFRHDLALKKLPVRWDEALPQGNGMVGVLVWNKEGKLRLSLDRADLWDLRPTADLDQLDFAKVRRHVESNTYDEVIKLGDVPYERDPAPTKIPGAAIEFDIQSLGLVKESRLFIREGTAQIIWDNGSTFTSFVHPSLPLGWFRLTGASLAPDLVPPLYSDDKNVSAGNSVQGQGLARLGYAQGQLRRGSNQITYVQPGWNGFEYRVSLRWQVKGDALEGVWTITSNYQGSNTSSVETLVQQAMERGYENDLRGTKNWWQTFWSKSSVTLPDSLLERQWYLEQYKFGCVARSNTPPITLQAIWTADNGSLPPWKGDIHNDLNLQLSYWPAYSGNHMMEAEGMVNWLSRTRPEFEKWTRSYFGVNGLNVPGVCTLDGKAMGGWIQYSLSPTTAGWLGHHFYLHWRYSMDRDFLRMRAYPWVRDFASFIRNISIKNSNGKRQLPLSSSPEFFDNSVKAWFRQTTNYDLAIIRWSYSKASEMATELGLSDEATVWEEELKQWPDLAVDESGLLLAPGAPYPESHRHFSHLLGVHPLGLLKYDDQQQRKLVNLSIEHLTSKGTEAWVGYSFAWLGNVYARMGKGDEAAQALRTFASCFCLSNSFHANGDQCGGKHSSYTYRPFTLEGNFAFAAGVQEMLLQSHDGVLRIFPAVPEAWQNVGFTGLRAEGAFVISAKRSAGKLVELMVLSEKGGELLVENVPAHFNLPVEISTREGTRVRIRTKPGQRFILP